MTPNIATDRRANLLGSLWMVAAMAGFAIEDALIKAATQTLPIGQVMVLFGCGGALVFSAMARRNGEPLVSSAVVSLPMVIRVIFEVFGRLCYSLSLALISLATTTVILQATPLVVVAGATLVFGEQVGWRRWAAIVIGLIGVIVIIQPGTDGFSALSILAILGMIGFAGRDLASRAAPAALSTSILGLYGLLAIAVAGAGYTLWSDKPFGQPNGTTLIYLAGTVLFGVLAYASLMKAMRTGEVSAVTPLRYTRLLFGIALGVLVFGETLTAAMLLGGALIVLSGLFILWRGQKAGSA
ncbi:MAG: DMT family transporter [Marinovum sp.]|nr:DMT family transporter [Marinovum sp.]